MATRIYIIESKSHTITAPTCYVRASTPAGALAALSALTRTCRTATVEDMIGVQRERILDGTKDPNQQDLPLTSTNDTAVSHFTDLTFGQPHHGHASHNGA